MNLLQLAIDIDISVVLWLSLASLVSWFISTLTSGGSSLILMPIIGLLLGTPAIPPVITVGATLGNIERAIAYRKTIRWEVIRWELAGAVVGSCLGAFTLTQIHTELLSIIVAFFLLASAVSTFTKKKTVSFPVQSWYFLPAGFFYAWLSGILGSIGPVLTPFYLNYGLSKEELLATAAAARAAIHLVKVAAYAVFGVLTFKSLCYGVLIGVAAFPGNWLGQLALERTSEHRFRQIVMGFVVMSAVLMLWQQREFLRL